MSKAEVWLSGPLTGMPALLQPVAHALLQAREEVNELMASFPDALLWEKPAGMASPGFHLQHMAGVLDRLYTYTRAEQLDQQQLGYLAMEGKNVDVKVDQLLNHFNDQVEIAIKQLSETNEALLTEVRGVGRANVPSTVIGILMHSAEHTMRHVGQLLVTVKILLANN